MKEPMTTIQHNLLGLLKKFDTVCKDNSITYYLGGGCLLGAVRNAGFIPWDDDVDVHMTKDNADRLQHCAESFSEDLVIINSDLYPEFHHDFWRFMDTSVTSSTPMSSVTDVPAGQYIDIFILDPMSGDPDVRKYADERSELYKELRNELYISDSVRDREFFLRYKKERKRQSEEGRENVLNGIKKEIPEISEEGCAYYKVRRPGPSLILPADIFGEPQRVRFEDTFLPVPQKPELFLEAGYGSRWMELPPVTARNVHPIVSDFDVPYTFYDEEVKKYMDKDSSKDVMKRKKDAIFDSVPDRNVTKSVGFKIKGEVIKYKLNKAEKNGTGILRLAEDLEIKKLKRIFKRFYDIQLKEALYFREYVDISDDYLYAAMIPLIYTGEYIKVLKILELRSEEKNLTEDNRLSEIKKLADDISLMTHELYVNKDIAKAKQIVDDNLKKWKWVINLLRADIYVRLRQKEDMQSTGDRVLEYLKMYPFDGELLAYYAETLFNRGDADRARTFYLKAYPLTRNELVRSDIMLALEDLGDEN